MNIVTKFVAVAALAVGLASVPVATEAAGIYPAVCQSRALSATKASADCTGGRAAVRVVILQSNGAIRRGPWVENGFSKITAQSSTTIVSVWHENPILPVFDPPIDPPIEPEVQGIRAANHTVPAVCAARLLTYTRASADCWGGPHWVRVIARQSNGVTRYGYWALNDHSQVYAIWPHTFVSVRYEVILP